MPLELYHREPQQEPQQKQLGMLQVLHEQLAIGRMLILLWMNI
jgi:hypothetical protein